MTFTSDPAVPVIVSPISVAFVPGQFFTYQIEVSTSTPDDPLSFYLFGTLPQGLMFDVVTGTIFGTPKAATALQPSPQVAGG